MPTDVPLRPAPAEFRKFVDAQPGTITVYSDIGCPWGSLTLFLLRAEISRLAAQRRPVIEHRAFPLELFNRQGTPKPILDAEIAVVASTEPSLGWSPWRRPDSEYPVTMLPALEAVQAARQVNGAAAADQLDAALREAFYVDSRNISLITEIVAVAEECPAVDAELLHRELYAGTHRAMVHDDFETSSDDAVQGSPHLFLSDGRNIHNPGVRFEWTAAYGRGFPVIREYRPDLVGGIVAAALEEDGEPPAADSQEPTSQPAHDQS